MKADEKTRSSIKRALATSQLQGAGLEVVQFISAQLPRDVIMSTALTEDAEESDSHSVLQSILVLATSGSAPPPLPNLHNGGVVGFLHR